MKLGAVLGLSVALCVALCVALITVAVTMARPSCNPTCLAEWHREKAEQRIAAQDDRILQLRLRSGLQKSAVRALLRPLFSRPQYKISLGQSRDTIDIKADRELTHAQNFAYLVMYDWPKYDRVSSWIRHTW